MYAQSDAELIDTLILKFSEDISSIDKCKKFNLFDNSENSESPLNTSKTCKWNRGGTYFGIISISISVENSQTVKTSVMIEIKN